MVNRLALSVVPSAQPRRETQARLLISAAASAVKSILQEAGGTKHAMNAEVRENDNKPAAFIILQAVFL